MSKFSKADSCCVKFFLLILNIIFLLFGGLVLGVSIYAWTGTSAGLSSIPSDVVIGGMSVGAVLVVVSIFGFGAMRSRGCLAFYALLLLLLISAQVAIGVLAYQNTTIDPETTLDNIWTNLPENGRILIQNEGNCCGFANSNDRQAVDNKQCFAKNSPLVSGCYPKMQQNLQNYSKIAYISLFSFLALELLTFFLALFVLCGCCGIYSNSSAGYQNGNGGRNQEQEQEALKHANELNRQ